MDAGWPLARVAVERDSWGVHATRLAFEKDRARDRDLHVAGWRVVRITWRQLHADEHALARQLRILLATDTVRPP